MFRRGIIRCYSSLKNEDLVSIKNLHINCITGKDFWSRPVLQPLSLSVDLKTSFTKASQNDDLKYSLNYATISRDLLEFFDRNKHRNFHSMELISDLVLQMLPVPGTVVLENSKSEIRCQNVELTQSEGDDYKVLKINGLSLLTVIGIFKFERLQKQIVELNIELTYKDTLNYHDLIKEITEYVELANFKTVEALVENVSYIVLNHSDQISDTKVGVWKPNAILFADGVGVSVKRESKDLSGMNLIQFDSVETDDISIPNFNTDNEFNDNTSHTAYIAFGSNEGDQFDNIYKALSELPQRGIDIISTSTIYKSKPMYYLDQKNFYNGVIKVSTLLKPHDLLKLLKLIEYDDLQRVKLIENGPRSIDLDILLYDDLILNDQDLKIPHVSMVDRTFVMAPLCELCPPDQIHPVTAETLHSHLDQLLLSESDPELQLSNELVNVIPMRDGKLLKYDSFNNKNKTWIMGILNITPDSFSDAGSNFTMDKAMSTVESMIANGVDIIDIGGCSTRPGSVQASEEEELQRVIPVVKEIRSRFGNAILLSIDTYRAKVAEESILAGADIINDIAAGQFDDRMFDVIAQYRVPYIVNHTRGDIDTMTQLTDYSKFPEDVQVYDNGAQRGLDGEEELFVRVMGEELLQQINKLFEKGVYKWQIILDPGIGFAKTVKQNLASIKTTPTLKQLSFSHGDNYLSMQRLPVLLGPSRKKFIGAITKIDDPKERAIANYSTVMACMGYQGDIIRVHDYIETNEIRMIADSLYKNYPIRQS